MNDSSDRKSPQATNLDDEVFRLTLRRAHGEATAAELRQLGSRLHEQPEWVEPVERLESSWNQLEPPPTTPVPPGFSTSVTARARELRRSDGLSWAGAPTWLRAAAASVLIGGVALGASIGALVAQPANQNWGLEQQSQVSENHWSVQDAEADQESLGSALSNGAPWNDGPNDAGEAW